MLRAFKSFRNSVGAAAGIAVACLYWRANSDLPLHFHVVGSVLIGAIVGVTLASLFEGRVGVDRLAVLGSSLYGVAAIAPWHIIGLLASTMSTLALVRRPWSGPAVRDASIRRLTRGGLVRRIGAAGCAVVLVAGGAGAVFSSHRAADHRKTAPTIKVPTWIGTGAVTINSEVTEAEVESQKGETLEHQCGTALIENRLAGIATKVSAAVLSAAQAIMTAEGSLILGCVERYLLANGLLVIATRLRVKEVDGAHSERAATITVDLGTATGVFALDRGAEEAIDLATRGLLKRVDMQRPTDGGGWIQTLRLTDGTCEHVVLSNNEADQQPFVLPDAVGRLMTTIALSNGALATRGISHSDGRWQVGFEVVDPNKGQPVRSTFTAEIIETPEGASTATASVRRGQACDDSLELGYLGLIAMGDHLRESFASAG